MGLARNLRQQNFKLEGWGIVPSQNLIRSGTDKYHIEPMNMDVLVVLARHAPEVLRRDDIIDQVWGVEYGRDESLTRAISIIRKILASDGSGINYIETIRKRGYRLTVPVRFDDIDQSSGHYGFQKSMPSNTVKKPRKKKWRIGAIAVMAILVSAGFFVKSQLSLPESEVMRASAQAFVTKPDNVSNVASIAVLPFIAIAANKDDEYIGLGITEELLNSLAGIEQLAVAARTSAFQYKNQDLDIRKIGNDLGVDYLVEGSVRRSKNILRITAQLIRTEDGFHIWSETFDRDNEDVFEIQNDIVWEISKAIQIRLGVGEGAGIYTGGDINGSDINPVATELFYKGMHLWANRMRTNGAFLRAYHSINSAVEIAPEFGDAWAAKVHILSVINGGPLFRDRLKYVEEMEEAIDNANRYAPNNGAFHGSLVVWFARSDINLPKARYHMQRAEELAPHTYLTQFARAMLEFVEGDEKASIEGFDRALSLNPDDLIGQMARAMIMAMVGRSSDAFEFFDKCEAEDCMGEGFVPYASTAAALSDDPRHIDRWRPIFTKFASFLKFVPGAAKPEVTRVIPAYIAIEFENPDKAKQVEKIQKIFNDEIITDSVGTWGPVFAEFLPQERLMDLLEASYDRKEMFSAPYGFSAYYGRNPYPDWVLKHPRYHALWERPGMKELADTRRKNGWTDGLPIFAD